MKHSITIFLSLLTALFLSACASSFVQTKDFNQPNAFAIDENAKIETTNENIEILELVQKYRNAIVNKDIQTLKSMISENYYENASTTDTTDDDYGNEKIEELLTEYLSNIVKEVRYVIEIKQLTRSQEKVFVDYQYIWSFRFETEGQSHWHTKNDVNRLTFVQENASWKIIAGL